ncbi:MAG: acylphosphatase [Myxococcota bacterium]
MTARIRRRVVVTGRVQGVWFRGATAEQARARGLAGWVRNLRDGRVEAVFEGPADAVEALVAFVHEGPSHAQVRSVEVSDEPPLGETDFQVRY